MDVRAVVGDIATQEVDAVVVNLFQGVQSPGGGTGAVDKALDGAISGLIADGEIKGKEGGAHPHPLPREDHAQAGARGRPW